MHAKAVSTAQKTKVADDISLVRSLVVCLLCDVEIFSDDEFFADVRSEASAVRLVYA